MKSKMIIVALLITSVLTYGQGQYDEKQEKKIYQLEEYQEMNREIDEKIIYIKNLINVGSDFHNEILIEYEELKKELSRDIEILKLEVKNEKY